MDPSPELEQLHYDRPVAIYARLSRNPDGTRDSVANQIAAARRYIERVWPGREVLIFQDDNITAAREDVVRPGYEDLLKAIRRGQVGDVYARMQARITRLPGPWAKFRVACTRAGIEDLHTTKGLVGLASGRSLPGRIMNLFDEEFVETTRLSVCDTLDELARQGRPSGGRAYGYRHARNEAHEAVLLVVSVEAVVIQLVAQRLLAGRSLASIVRELNDQGSRRRNGNPWDTGAIHRMVTSPTVTALRVHQGQVVGEGNWEPILDRDTWHAVRAVLEQPRMVRDPDGRERVFTGTRRPARRYLLTGGVAVCDLCDNRLIGQARRVAKTGPTFHYVCSSARGGCGHLSCIGPPMEAYTTERFLDYVTTPAFLAGLAAGDADTERRAELKVQENAIEQRRTDAALAVARGEISTTMAGIIERGLDEELVKVRQGQAQLAPLGPVALDPQALVMGWDTMELDERRAALFGARCSVRVRPAEGRRGFSPERVAVSFGGVQVPS